MGERSARRDVLREALLQVPRPEQHASDRSGDRALLRMSTVAGVITGAHAIIFANDPEKLRAFFSDVLELPSVDAGGGWQIFALPPAELAVHPSDDPHHEMYLMCEDIQTTVDQLKAKGVEFARPVTDAGWGLLTALALPGGGELALYEPKHRRPIT